MIKLEDLKAGDKFYLVDVQCDISECDHAVVECKVVKKYAKSRKYILVRALNYVYPGEKEAVNFRNGEPFDDKLYKSLETYMFDIDSLSEAIDVFNDYEHYYELGIRHGSLYCDLDPYELGKYISEANDKACEELNCESCYCYNDECEHWNPEEHGGCCKSDYDDARAFISDLDPNDPADEWFFED